MKVNVNNVNTKSKYIVARVVDGELWFYDAWNDKGTAIRVAKEINGVVVENDNKD